jgi:hypothetical protein
MPCEGAGALPAPLLENYWASYPRENLLYPPLEAGKEHRDLTMRPDQTVTEMAEEILARQAKAMLAHTGQSFESALEAVASTQAGQQLRELANGEHRHEKAQDWQVSLFEERAADRLMDLGIALENTHSRFAEECHYSWVANYMEWLKGKEERPEYHALLEEELASLRG